MTPSRRQPHLSQVSHVPSPSLPTTGPRKRRRWTLPLNMRLRLERLGRFWKRKSNRLSERLTCWSLVEPLDLEKCSRSSCEPAGVSRIVVTVDTTTQREVANAHGMDAENENSEIQAVSRKTSLPVVAEKCVNSEVAGEQERDAQIEVQEVGRERKDRCSGAKKPEIATLSAIHEEEEPESDSEEDQTEVKSSSRSLYLCADGSRSHLHIASSDSDSQTTTQTDSPIKGPTISKPTSLPTIEEGVEDVDASECISPFEILQLPTHWQEANFSQSTLTVESSGSDSTFIHDVGAEDYSEDEDDDAIRKAREGYEDYPRNEHHCALYYSL